MTGTSMATPHVSGLAALLRSRWPELSAAQVRALIQDSAADLGATGYDPYYGYGRIDAAAALGVEPLPSPTATPSLTPTPLATHMPTPTVTPTYTPTPAATTTYAPTPTPTSSPTITPSFVLLGGHTYLETDGYEGFNPDSDQPLSGVTIAVLSPDDMLHLETSDANGRWVFSGPTGVYTITAPSEAQGYVLITEPIKTVILSTAGNLNVDFGYVATTSLDVVYVRAHRNAAGVQIQWAARTAATLKGFNIYRSLTPHERGLKINPKLLPPLAPPGEMAEYTYMDTPAPDIHGTCSYWLEIIVGQTSNWIGPFSPTGSASLYLPLITGSAR